MTQEELRDFLDEYVAVTSDVSRSNSATFGTNLERWFETLDSAPIVSRHVRDLEATIDFPAWKKAGDETMSGMVGSGELRWPSGTQRIAMQVAMFRAIVAGTYSYSAFDRVYFGETRYDNMVNNISVQVFQPMARDLRKHLIKVLTAVEETSSATAPASDRVVRLDHNNPDYKKAVSDLEGLEDALRGTNDYADEQDKQQRLAEVSAARRLLASVRVRVEALVALVYRGLRYIAQKFADQAIGVAALALIALLGRVTGLW